MQKIVQGGQSSLTVRLNYIQNGIQGDPIDLTGIYDIKSCFMNADGTELTLSKQAGSISVVGNAVLGKVAINFTAAQSALLALVDAATLEVDLIATLGADPVKIQIPSAYSVMQSVC